MKILLLSGADVVATCGMKQCIEAVREAFALYARGRVEAPLRTRIGMSERRSVLVMAAAEMDEDAPISVKVVSVYPDLRREGGAVTAWALLLDGRDGGLRAIMEGGVLTALRTGAVSGLASRYLARRDSEVLGIIGAGGQAFHQVNGVSVETGIRRVKVYSRHAAKARALARRLEGELDVQAEACPSAKSCAAGSDVVVTTTTSPTPVLTREMVEPGTLVIAVGAYTPETREVDTDLVRDSSVYADSVEAVMAEAGDLLIPIKEGAIARSYVKGDLSQLVVGKVRGRRSGEELILFKSVGLAFEDTAVARLAFRRASAAGLGQFIEFG